MQRTLLWFLPVIVLLFARSASALTLDAENIGISKWIPKQGDEVSWLVPVVNDGESPFEGEVIVSFRCGRRGEQPGKPSTVRKHLKLQLRQSEDLTFKWPAPRNGYYRVEFALQGTDQRASKELAVTRDDVHFAWFGAPKTFRWCNVPTTVKDADQSWWLRRGAIPAHWKGGVCYKNWPVERFVEDWGKSDWIAIDEVGGPGEVTDKFLAAWKQLKQRKPHQWTAVWFMGAHAYWRDIRKLVDLFLPEIYLNYSGNHLGHFEPYFRTAREAGVMDQMIPGLGINQIKDKQGRVTNSPTQEDVLRQIRYLKRAAPELKGVGFFTSNSAAPGVAEYADGLCEEYYIKPVLTIRNPGRPIALSGKPADPKRVASIAVKNVGNMDAEDVRIEWRWGRPESAQVKSEIVREWPVGREKTFSVEVTCEVGWMPLEFRVVPREGYTVVDGVATATITRPPGSLASAVVAVLAAGATNFVWPQFGGVGAGGSLRAVELEPDGKLGAEMPCAALPARPGISETQAVLLTRMDRPRVALLSAGGDRAIEGPRHLRKGSEFTVSNNHYETTLDLATDQLVSIGPRGGMANVLRQPLELKAIGHEGFQGARIEELPGCLVVTVSYDSEKASGESQYLFFTDSPAIRIARSWRPKGELTLKGAGDRCGLFQKGGTFALQAGVGGPVKRGQLQDGNKYRDLLFGYLGERPRPDNADRAGWIDFSYGAEGADGGLGVAIEYRWTDSDSNSYDVTRLYDASDWLEVLYLWGKEKVFSRPQKSCIWLVPHRRLDFSDEHVAPPAQELWQRLHAEQLSAVHGPSAAGD